MDSIDGDSGRRSVPLPRRSPPIAETGTAETRTAADDHPAGQRQLRVSRSEPSGWTKDSGPSYCSQSPPNIRHSQRVRMRRERKQVRWAITSLDVDRSGLVPSIQTPAQGRGGERRAGRARQPARQCRLFNSELTAL